GQGRCRRAQVALRVQGCDVGIDYGCHGNSPKLVLLMVGDLLFNFGPSPCSVTFKPLLLLVTVAVREALGDFLREIFAVRTQAEMLPCAKTTAIDGTLGQKKIKKAARWEAAARCCSRDCKRHTA
ncbi:hypothetical protein, partial [Pseudoduganella buxea]|uniref:hypothetical protein n=1 Tax=Pseudoduganella buxea TaxID=1949069 RepID=UPI001B8C58AC